MLPSLTDDKQEIKCAEKGSDCKDAGAPARERHLLMLLEVAFLPGRGRGGEVTFEKEKS